MSRATRAASASTIVMEGQTGKNISLLPNWAGNLVPEDTDDAGGLNTSFV